MNEDAVRIVVEDGDDPPNRPPLPGWVLLAAVAALAGVGIGWAVLSQVPTNGNEASAATTTTAAFPGNTAPTSAAAPPTSTTTTAVPSAPPTSDPQNATGLTVMLLDGASALQADVALATQPGESGGGSLWVFRTDGSVVHRNDVPLWPGDYPYPILMTGGRIVFANLTDSYLIDAELTETPEPLTEASFVIPGATPDLVWFIGRGVEWVAPVDVESQTVGERIDVTDVFRWPLAGFADGLIVSPTDEETYGRVAYWSPIGGLRSVELRNPQQSFVRAVSGNIAAVVSPGVLSMVDLPSGDYLSTFDLDLGEGHVPTVCLSPDQRHVAVTGLTAEAFVGDTHNGAITKLPSGIHGWKSIGWTSNDQLVYIIDVEGETFIQTLDITTGETHDIAALHGFRGWSLAASGTMC